MQDSSVVVDSILRSHFCHEVDSVGDFDICDGVPGCDLEMASGYSVWTPTQILKSH